MPPDTTDTFDEVWDCPVDHEEEQRRAQRAKPAKQVLEPRPETVQEEWSRRLCRHGLNDLRVSHADHGPCVIVESNWLSQDASCPTLLLWLVPDQDSISCLTDLHLVPASDCQLLEEWPTVCCRMDRTATRCRR